METRRRRLLAEEPLFGTTAPGLGRRRLAGCDNSGWGEAAGCCAR